MAQPKRLSDLIGKKGTPLTTGDPFGSLGHLSPGQRIERGRDPNVITEDDPRWKPKKRRRRSSGRSMAWDDAETNI